MSKEILGRDITGAVDFSLTTPVPESCWNSPLTANVVTTMTAPSNYNRAFFGFAPGTTVWVTYDGSTPVVPVGASFSSQELNPGIRQLNGSGTQSLKFISDTASTVSITFQIGQ